MTTNDPVWATVAELSRAFGARTLSPVDAVEALIGRIRRRNPALHAYIAVYETDARLAAEAADKAIRAGHRVGPLHGVPIALKDLVDLEGRVTTGGSKVWAERVSPVTATLAERLIAAGMIVLGKTHTVEFAMGSWGTNTHMGTPRNPWDLKVHRTPGGSSSGSGVAVASGMAPVAIVLQRSASASFPPDRRSAMMPEPITAATRSAVPRASAVKRRARSKPSMLPPLAWRDPRRDPDVSNSLRCSPSALRLTRRGSTCRSQGRCRNGWRNRR